MDAPDHPSQVGWRNSTHLIGRRAYAAGMPKNATAIVNVDAEPSAVVWSAPHWTKGAKHIGELALKTGDEHPLLAISAGEEAALGHSAETYRLSYQLALPTGKTGWVQAAVPWNLEVGTDGRPCSIRYNLVPTI
jgi:hypothetical protein